MNFVEGKTWGWQRDSDGVTFISGKDQLPTDFATGKLLFARDKPDPNEELCVYHLFVNL